VLGSLGGNLMLTCGDGVHSHVVILLLNFLSWIGCERTHGRELHTQSALPVALFNGDQQLWGVGTRGQGPMVMIQDDEEWGI
jgi:hypothetical protein